MFEVKNKRLKMSPGGVISLPVAARKALGMTPGEAANVGVVTGESGVVLMGNSRIGPESVRVSKRGQLVLTGPARAYLNDALKRHYWLELNDDQRTATLKAY